MDENVNKYGLQIYKGQSQYHSVNYKGSVQIYAETKQKRTINKTDIKQ